MRRGFVLLASLVLCAATTAPGSGFAFASTPSGGVDGPALAAAALAGSPVTVPMGAYGRATLLLAPSRVVTPATRYTQTGADAVPRPVAPQWFATLAGSVAGVPGSVVRLTVTRSWVSGFVATHSRVVTVSPDRWDRPTRTVFADPAAAPASPAALRDAEVPAPAAVRASRAANTVEVDAFGAGNCAILACDTLTAEVILDGDAAFRALAPATCLARQAAVLNDTDGIYLLAATNIRLHAAQVNCRASADLGAPGTAALPLLESLRAAWTNVGVDRSLVFLSVGSTIPDNLIGIAYRPGVCSRLTPEPVDVLAQRCAYGYGLGQMSGVVGTAFVRAKLAAHEIGHSFNATHEEATGCSSTSSGTGDIMCPIIQNNGPNRFSAANAQQIRAHAESTIGYVAHA